jgi:hypothetical protein
VPQVVHGERRGKQRKTLRNRRLVHRQNFPFMTIAPNGVGRDLDDKDYELATLKVNAVCANFSITI